MQHYPEAGIYMSRDSYQLYATKPYLRVAADLSLTGLNSELWR
jgi:hypothetical protein